MVKKLLILIGFSSKNVIDFSVYHFIRKKCVIQSNPIVFDFNYCRIKKEICATTFAKLVRS